MRVQQLRRLTPQPVTMASGRLLLPLLGLLLTLPVRPGSAAHMLLLGSSDQDTSRSSHQDTRELGRHVFPPEVHQAVGALLERHHYQEEVRHHVVVPLATPDEDINHWEPPPLPEASQAVGVPLERDPEETPEETQEQAGKPQVDPCTLKAARGFGRSIKRRFFYNPASGKCESFRYGGMGGNANCFKTKEDCEERCVSPSPDE